MEPKYLYFYGVMPAGAAPAKLKGAGLGGSDVEAVTCGELDALISRVEPGAVHLEAEAALAHEQVLMTAMRSGTVIPAAFGHLFESKAELCGLLDSSALELQANLTYLKGRVEMGLKAIWTKDSFLPDIETPELQDLARQAQQPGTDQSVTLAVGRLVEQLVTERREQYSRAICARLEPHAVETKLNDTLAVRMVLNAAFLVEQEHLPAFQRELEAAVNPYRNRLEFSITGPWPAHNFSRIRL